MTHHFLLVSGYRLTWISGSYINTTLRFSVVWKKNTDEINWIARHNMTEKEYDIFLKQYENAHFEHLHVYTVNNTVYYAAIMHEVGFE